LRAALLVALVVSAACASAPVRRPGDDETAAAASAPANIVTVEGKGERGGRLVWVDQNGARLGDLTPGESKASVDMHPSWSHDGEWVVFSSNRDRSRFQDSSLWLVRARPGAEPIRLTQGEPVDRDPRFMPGDRAIVYAAHIGDGSFDLWYLPLSWPSGHAQPPKPGRPRRLTRTDKLHELSPSPRPDGAGIVYMGIDPASKMSRLYWLALPNGTPVAITKGPFDNTPSFSPDGRTIAFSAAVKGRDDEDLFAMDVGGKHRRVLVEEPTADESGPVWSADGRYVFATAIVRSAQTGQALLSSLVFVDLRERKRTLRALHDPLFLENPLAYVPRLGVAVGPAGFDAARLHQNWSHRKAADAILTKAVNENQRQQQQEPAPATPP
jgi:dipeptidyl aminopeptidase/acylaminoacyl peptidase